MRPSQRPHSNIVPLIIVAGQRSAAGMLAWLRSIAVPDAYRVSAQMRSPGPSDRKITQP